MKASIKFGFGLIILILFGVSCNPTNVPTDPPTETQFYTAVPLPTRVTNTPIPTPTMPTVSVDCDTDCRSGPDFSFEYLGVLLAGESARS